MEKTKLLKFKNIFTWLCFAAYVVCAGVLIFEASMDGQSSANQSNTIGGGIADIINDGKGDTSQAIIPTKVKINNKIETAYVGDTYQLDTSIEPENSTFSSLIYSSSNTSIATVSETGLITFNNEGTTNIQITNYDYKDLVDSFDITVLPINVATINYSLSYRENNTDIDLENTNDTYDLWIDKEFKINVELLPLNATHKNYSITSNSTNFSISNNTIIPSKMSDTYEDVTIKVSDELTKVFKVKIIQVKNYINIEKLEFASKNPINLLLGNNTTINSSLVAYEPKFNNGISTPTENQIRYEIEDQTIAKLINGKTIQPLKVGTTKIKIISVTDETKFDEKDLIIKNVPLTSFKLSLGGKVNSTTITDKFSGTFQLTNLSPLPFSYMSKIRDNTCFQKQFTYDESILTITNSSGAIKAKGLGTTNVVLTLNKITNGTIEYTLTSSISITVKEEEPPEEVTYTKENIKYTLDSTFYDKGTNGEKILYVDTTYDLNSKVKTEIINVTNPNLVSKNKEIHFDEIKNVDDNLINEYDEEANQYIQITSGKYKFLKPCKVSLYFIHSESKFDTHYTDDSFTFYVVNNLYKPQLKLKEEINVLDTNPLEILINNYNIDIKSKKEYTLEFPHKYNIKAKNLNTNNFEYKIYNTNEYSYIDITNNKEGSIEFVVSSIYNENHLVNNEKTIKINSTYVKLLDESKFNYRLLKNEEELTSDIINSQKLPIYESYVKETINVDFNFDYEDLDTVVEPIIEVEDPTIVKVQNNDLILNETGKTIVTLKDKISNFEKKFQINSYNTIKFEEDMFKVKGKINKTDENGILHVYTATSIKISPNLTSDTTYKTAKFSSSEDDKKKEDKILDLREDGTITTISEGLATVAIEVNDGFTPFNEALQNGPRKISLQIQVDPKPFINEENISNFLLLIRKSLGHFGAFLVLGICSTLFYLLKFDKKKWFFSVPINIVQGLGIAALTELIQVFVPGRSGLVRDVLIDFSGFLVSSVIITIVIIATYFIKKYINKKKELKNNDKN